MTASAAPDSVATLPSLWPRAIRPIAAGTKGNTARAVPTATASAVTPMAVDVARVSTASSSRIALAHPTAT